MLHRSAITLLRWVYLAQRAKGRGLSRDVLSVNIRSVQFHLRVSLRPADLLGCDGQARGQVHHRLGEQDEKQIGCVEAKPQRATSAPVRPSAVRRPS